MTQIGDREFYPSFSEKQKSHTVPGPDCRLHETKFILLFHLKRSCFVCTVGWSIVAVEEDSTQACLRSFPPKCIEDFGQIFCYKPICSDSSLIFHWNCSNMATGTEERADHFFPTLLFTFVGGFSPGRLPFRFWIILIYPAFVTCYDVKYIFWASSIKVFQLFFLLVKSSVLLLHC